MEHNQKMLQLLLAPFPVHARMVRSTFKSSNPPFQIAKGFCELM